MTHLEPTLATTFSKPFSIFCSPCLKYPSCFSLIYPSSFQLRRLRQDEFKPSLGYKVRHTPSPSARGPQFTYLSSLFSSMGNTELMPLTRSTRGRLTSTRSQKNTLPSSEQLTTCVSRSLRQQSSLYCWFLWPTYLAVGVGRIRGACPTPEVG